MDNSSNTRSIEFQIKGEYVKLCNLLKLVGIAESSGRSKALVAEGAVKVDGRPESRKAAKIRAGQVVECLGIEIKIGS